MARTDVDAAATPVPGYPHPIFVCEHGRRRFRPVQEMAFVVALAHGGVLERDADALSVGRVRVGVRVRVRVRFRVRLGLG